MVTLNAPCRVTVTQIGDSHWRSKPLRRVSGLFGSRRAVTPGQISPPPPSNASSSFISSHSINTKAVLNSQEAIDSAYVIFLSHLLVFCLPIILTPCGRTRDLSIFNIRSLIIHFLVICFSSNFGSAEILCRARYRRSFVAKGEELRKQSAPATTSVRTTTSVQSQY